MSYRSGSSYRGPSDRSRSPPRFADRRGSTANSIFDGRHSGPPPPRNAADAPRGPRSQFDGPPTRGPPQSGLGSGAPPRRLADAPPLGSGERPRPSFRERDYPDRRERSPPPRERSPPRNFKEPRDFPPRDIDIRSARRASRDGPPSAGSNYSDGAPFSGSSYRGGFGRGRGRGDFDPRGSTRGGRRAIDDRGDLFPSRNRSPPSRFGRDLSRDGRDPERREERRFDRREDDRRPDWVDRERERERELDRTRRDPPPARLESRMSSDTVPSANSAFSTPADPPINPARLAIIESSGADPAVRRSSTTPMPGATTRRDPPPETPAYLNGRAETTANRYGSRGSSPPTQAPPVPAFSFSVVPTPAAPSSAPKNVPDAKPAEHVPVAEEVKPVIEEKPLPPPDAPSAPKALQQEPPPSAPKAPRALDIDAVIPPSNRLHGVRSLENISRAPQHQVEDHVAQPPSSMPPSPRATRQALPHLAQPVSPNPPQAPRFDVAVPTGPKASRVPPVQPSLSPRPHFASPRSDTGAFQHTSGHLRGSTPPPTAPSGPRNRSFSVSPKVTTSSIPTAPKSARAPPVAPRAIDRLQTGQNRVPQRGPGTSSFGASGARQWNTWTRPGAPIYGEKLGPGVPAKRDVNGEEKERGPQIGASLSTDTKMQDIAVKTEDLESRRTSIQTSRPSTEDRNEDDMELDVDLTKRKPTAAESQSATHASFFGGALERPADDIDSSSEDDELDEEEDATLLEAKHARKERELRSQMVDLSLREYRATSPLESLARLARLTEKDLEQYKQQRKDDMELDDAPLEPSRQTAPAAAHSSSSEDGPEILTPQGEGLNIVTIREQEDVHGNVRRVLRRSSEPIALPFLAKEGALPLQESEAFQDTLQSLREHEMEMLDIITKEEQLDLDAEEDAFEAFELAYQQWRDECEELDKEREKQELLERQASLEPGLDLDAPAPAPINPIAEGRRTKLNISEYQMAQVLKESEEMARIEQEKNDREAKKIQADMEKEAQLPDLETEKAIARGKWFNENRLREADQLTLVFSYKPPEDTFTEKEQDVFIAAFKETPKKWGEIASLLPGRTYKDCIHHYYANKWDGRFRDSRTKRYKGRGGRGGRGKGTRAVRGSAMADLNRAEELAPANDSGSGRPKRAAAPTTFGEKEVESKNALMAQSPAKKPGPGSKQDANGEEKPIKKQRKTGEGKPGRKGKQQLAALAAAPSGSPNQKPAHTKDEITRGPTAEEVGLLAGLHRSHHESMAPEHQGMYVPDGMLPQLMAGDDAARQKLAPAAKQSASSYWSVPEQTDFHGFIAHFGTDFAAIAAHMGTKTATMIKNHYQRQVDGGRAELKVAAEAADQRKQRGEDPGPPPQPTPIVKRKYDNPQTNTPRALAPQGDAMDVDDSGPPLQASAPPKHVSPPQYQSKPQRFTTSAQSTPIQAPRVVPSPHHIAATPAPSMPPTAQHSRPPVQHPLGSRASFLADNRPESGPGLGPGALFGMSREPVPAPSRNQPPPPQPARTLSHPANPDYINSLRQEQEKALRMQQAEQAQLTSHDEQMRMDQTRMEQLRSRQHQSMAHAHGSPANQPLAMPAAERKPLFDDSRPPSRGGYLSSGVSRGPLINPHNPMTAGLGASPLVALAGAGRPPYVPSPPKPDASRPGSVAAPLSTQQPPIHVPGHSHSQPPVQAPPAPTPAPEAPKKSNLMNLLNNDTEETKPGPKRDSLPSASSTRVASPAPPFNTAPTPQPSSNLPTPRRETFGHSSLPGANYHRSSFGQPASTPASQPAALKHETSGGVVSLSQQPPKEDWRSAHLYGHGNQPSPPAQPPLDRDPRDPRDGARPLFGFPGSHRGYGPLNPPSRANPSPPPHMIGHSRTPSLSAQQQREQQRAAFAPPSTQPPVQSLSANPYGRPEQPTSYHQAPPQAQNRAHHSHNSSITERPGYFSYGAPSSLSREEAMRREDEAAARHHHYRMEDDRLAAIAAERQRDMAQREEQAKLRHAEQRELELRRQEQVYGRDSRGAMHPSFGTPFASRQPFGAPSMRETGFREPGLREQASREVAERMQEEERRMQFRTEPPAFLRERERQYNPVTRPEEQPLFRRSTPSNGYPPYGQPPPGSRR
ncbi:putative DNA-binding protein SNT1 [Pseudocercospora fuligena]|uniref:Putative DNA-binding protein SNT1 n=1 Tax=Pseudocercospora fuligena TaxID=685502 RepID=A0A8H6VEZ3_9PEZI|nr:putative DNA-binding protein SNT1 [Pseudocercospora fuligena]